jgi:hypothetical protein
MQAEPPPMPFVFRTQALASLQLDDDQRAAICELQRQFTEEIGGPNQDPSDPAYLERWRRAQPKIDELLVGVIGRRTLIELEAIPETDTGGAEGQ